MVPKVIRRDIRKGTKEIETVSDALYSIEAMGWYPQGTIGTYIKRGLDFTLKTPYAYWDFIMGVKDDT